jgi:hypothetical protein
VDCVRFARSNSVHIVIDVSPSNRTSALTVIGVGEYDLSPSVAAPFTIKTSFVFVLLEEHSGVCSISIVIPVSRD